MKAIKDNFDFEQLETLPSHEKMRPAGEWPGHENIPYKRIHRWLESNVGRNWNDVYSEFCHKFKSKTRTPFDLLRWEVELNTFMDGKKVMAHGFRNKPIEILKESPFYRQDFLYVHPETNILCRIKHKKIDYEKLRKEENLKTLRILGPYHQLQKHNGIWYELQIFGMTEEIRNSRGGYFTKILGPEDRMNVKSPLSFRVGLDFKYYFKLSYTKKQLGKKELKKHGLK